MALVDLDAADTNTVVDVPCMLTEKFALISLVMPQSVNFIGRFGKCWQLNFSIVAAGDSVSFKSLT